MLYRVTWSVSGIPGREETHEFIASMEDAHAMWHQFVLIRLTTTPKPIRE
jgi:hypothetical protein